MSIAKGIYYYELVELYHNNISSENIFIRVNPDNPNEKEYFLGPMIFNPILPYTYDYR